MTLPTLRIFGAAVLLGMVTACHSGREERPAIYYEIDETLDPYLTHSAGARQAMLNALELIESVENREHAAELYWLTYARLFSIEGAGGDPALATIYLEKARYWYLIYREKSGDSPDKLVKGLNEVTPENVRALVLEWDKAAVGDKGPRYYREWIANQANPRSRANPESLNPSPTPPVP